MNIFYLDTSPVLAAQYHADKHIGKMMIEGAQLLFTSYHVMTGMDTPWKPTHRNHPCTLWLMESQWNHDWLAMLVGFLQVEWTYRWGRGSHKAAKMVEDFFVTSNPWPSVKWPSYVPTKPALAIADDCKMDDPVESYRQYYRKHKVHLHSWTVRGAPDWL